MFYTCNTCISKPGQFCSDVYCSHFVTSLSVHFDQFLDDIGKHSGERFDGAKIASREKKDQQKISSFIKVSQVTYEVQFKTGSRLCKCPLSGKVTHMH